MWSNKIIFVCLLFVCGLSTIYAENISIVPGHTMKLNTSNQGKLEEFKRLFAKYGYELDVSNIDLKEIDADPISVVTQKATQAGEGILIEDTSLDIEGASVGVNVRWLLDHLSELKGRKATWTVLLAYRLGDKILIFEGKVNGKIVEGNGKGGFGFDPVFLPDGATQTLAQAKPDEVNARAKAVQALIHGNVLTTRPLIENWKGPWQHE